MFYVSVEILGGVVAWWGCMVAWIVAGEENGGAWW